MEYAENYISALVEKYGDTILRIAYTYLKNMPDAEDAAQDVFLRIIEKKPDFTDDTHEKSWIIRTTINTCKNKLKLFWNKNTSPIDNESEISVFDKYEDESGVMNAVMGLPEKYRVVIHLYYYEEYTTPEIANIIGKNETTVRSLLHRARQQLKSVLKEAYDFE